MYYLKENKVQLIKLYKFAYRPVIVDEEFILVFERGSIIVDTVIAKNLSISSPRYEFEIDTSGFMNGQYHLKLVNSENEVLENYLVQIGEYIREDSNVVPEEIERIGF